MIDVAALVEGFDGEQPTGPNLSDSNEFAVLDRLYQDSFNPPELYSGGAEEPETHWDELFRLGEEFLEEQSKDLKVAVWMTDASIRVGGFGAFAACLELLHGLMDTHWEALHPSIPARASVLDWFCDDLAAGHVANAVKLVSLTTEGHRLHQYKEWYKDRDKPEEPVQGIDKFSKKEESEEEEAGFEEAFAATGREWYVELVASIDRCLATVDTLDSFCKERFSEAGETPPNFGRKIGASLQQMHTAASELLALKPAPIVEVDEPLPGEEETGEAGAVTGGPVVSVLKPRSAAEAARAISAGVRYLRSENPYAPGPYLVTRALRWGEILSTGAEVDPLLLDPPSTELRVSLKRKYLSKEWSELLEEAERAMETPAGRGWLDLHHYAIAATEALGDDYGVVTEALYGSLRGLLKDRPELVHMTLMDDSYTASNRTLEWLQASGLVDGAGAAGGAAAGRRPSRRPPPPPPPRPVEEAPAEPEDIADVAVEGPTDADVAEASADPTPVVQASGGEEPEEPEEPEESGKVQPTAAMRRLQALKQKKKEQEGDDG